MRHCHGFKADLFPGLGTMYLLFLPLRRPVLSHYFAIICPRQRFDSIKTGVRGENPTVEYRRIVSMPSFKCQGCVPLVNFSYNKTFDFDLLHLYRE